MRARDEDRALPDDQFADPIDVRSIALTGLFVLAVFYTLYAARFFFIPVALAVLLSFLLGPAVRALQRVGMPRSIGAALVLLVFLGGTGTAIYQLAAPAAAWLATAPASVQKVESKVRALRKPVDQVNEAAETVEHWTDGGNPTVPTVALKEESFGESFVGQSRVLLGAAVVVIVLLYFLLASRSGFVRKLVRLFPRREDRELAVEIVGQVEEQISRYLTSVTLINIGLGVTTGLAMFAIGLPNPALWGVMVGLFNFVPYVGPLTSMCVLGVVGLVTFDDLSWALLPPAVYFCIDTTESMLVTPFILGRRLALNPIMIFLAVFFWGWLWGVPGALLAVPMLATLKICCDGIKPLSAFGEFLEP